MAENNTGSDDQDHVTLNASSQEGIASKEALTNNNHVTGPKGSTQSHVAGTATNHSSVEHEFCSKCDDLGSESSSHQGLDPSPVQVSNNVSEGGLDIHGDTSRLKSKLGSFQMEDVEEGCSDEVKKGESTDTEMEDSVCDTEASSNLANNDSGVFTDKSCITESNSGELAASDSDMAAMSSDKSNIDEIDNDRQSETDLCENAGDDSHSSHGQSSDESDGSDQSGSRQRFMRRKRRVISSSSSDSSNEEEAEVNSSKSSKSSGNDEEKDTESYSFKQNWFVLPELLQRERGYGNRHCTSKFRWNTYSSLQMVQRLKIHHTMEYHDGCVNALNFNRIGTLLASGSDDLNVCIWNWQEKRPALTFESGHRSNVFQTKFIPYSGDCHVVTSSRDGQIRLAELSLTGVCKATKKIAQHRGSAHKLSLFTDDPHCFLSCGEDAVVFEIDLREQKPHKLVTTKENDRKVPLYSINANPMNSYEFCTGGRDHFISKVPLYSINANPMNSYEFCTGDRDHFIRIYDRRKITEDNDNPVKKYCPHHLVNEDDMKANVTCAVFNYNGTRVLGTYNDEDIYMFDTSHSDGADYIHRYSGHRNNATVKEVNFYGPNSEYVISGSDCGNIYVWDAQTENIVQYLHGDDAGVVNVLAPHPSLPVLATSGLDHDVKIWSPSAFQPTKLVDLKKTTEKNKSEREEERTHQPEMIDGQMLWFLMHLRRSARRRARQDGEEISSSSEGDSDDSDSDMDEDNSRRLGCATS